MKIVFLPIDNRPVCFQMPEMIAKTNKNIELLLPPENLLGSLTQNADTTELVKWLETSANGSDAIILSLDTIAYGGLIPSRRSPETFEQIKHRVLKIENILKNTHAKIYAFSSIMRISNNNVNEEEKEYWNLYGKKIFNYSFELDKTGRAKTEVPDEIINDYLEGRKRNFEINKLYLELQKKGLFDTLIFSKDDCAEFGLNVREARELEEMGGFTKTGADEIPLTLLARAIQENVKVCPKFLEPECRNLISNYEDISIEKSVYGQLELAGCRIVSEDKADVILFINNFKNKQGEIVMGQSTELFHGVLNLPNKPYAIADVRLANGADNNFIKQLLAFPSGKNFLGYAGWNTSANTLGSLICTIKFVLNAKNTETFDKNAFKKLEAVRLLDDWAYQANVRQQLAIRDARELKIKMQDYENIIKNYLNIEFVAEYSFPWDRLFEVKIELN